MKRLMLMLLMLCVLLTPTALAANRDAEDYSAALSRMREGSYAEASEAFAGLNAYEDAPQLAMYCAALNAAELGMYDIAVQNLRSLGDFRDAKLLATYYTARYYEAAQNYEKAGETLSGIELYRDSLTRLAGYPAKINARDYAAAEALEQRGKLEEALAAFEALGSYADSVDRAEAVREKINARDYAAAEALEQRGKLEEALEAFKALGSYADSADRAEAVRQEINERDYQLADAAEAKGDYATAYATFKALGDYADSAARAAALEQKSAYAVALRDAMNGEFTKAYAGFKSLGDYEDSALKAYALGVTEFATLEDKGNGIAAFQMHDVWGLLNVNENIATTPRWDRIGTFDSRGLAQVMKYEKYGLINQNDEIVCICQYDSIGSFNSEGLAKVSRNNLWGYINTAGEEVIPCKWWDVSDFRDGLCTVAKQDGSNILFGLMDASGNEITPAQWRSLAGSYSDKWNESIIRNYAHIVSLAFPGGVARVQNANGEWGFMDAQGNIVIEPQYAMVQDFSEGLAAVQKSGEWGFIDIENNVVIPFQYSEVTAFSGGKAHVYGMENGWQVIDKAGNTLYFATPEKLSAYRQASALLEAGDYEGAVAAFTKAGDYLDASKQIEEIEELAQEAQYARGEALLEAGDYEGAIALFTELGDYSDAAERVKEAQYARGAALLETGDYEGAIAAFAEAGNYLDAAEQLKEAHYRQANALKDAGDYAGAYEIYQILNGYKDVEDIIENDENISAARLAYFGELKVGSTVTFGAYEQDNDLSNGAEPIEWLVLDAYGDNRLLISKYGLETMPYNEGRADVTWETCTLRQWLNGDFYNTAFAAMEKAMIVETTIRNSGNDKTEGGNDTTDKVFLLSIDEANQYFTTKDERIATSTAYADAQGVAKNCWWWLRSPGRDQSHVHCIRSNGTINNSGQGIEHGDVCVRPVIWIGSGFPEPTPDSVEPAEPTPEPRTPYAALSRGDRSDDVARLQQALIEQGYLSGSADGDFGKGTEKAVKAAQRAFGMEETGVADDPFLVRLYGE